MFIVSSELFQHKHMIVDAHVLDKDNSKSTHKGVNQRSKYATPEVHPRRMYFWMSLCTLCLHACQVRFTEGDSGICCCTCVEYFERWWTPLLVDSEQALWGSFCLRLNWIQACFAKSSTITQARNDFVLFSFYMFKLQWMLNMLTSYKAPFQREQKTAHTPYAVLTTDRFQVSVTYNICKHVPRLSHVLQV